MKRYLPLFVLFIISHFLGAQSVPFPTGTRDNNALEPWGYNQVGTNWDTSPFLPFIYQNKWFRLMPPNGITYNRTTKTWTFPEPGKKYPLILFFHGLGETGTDNNNQLKNGGQRHRNAVQSGEFPGFLFYPQAVTVSEAKMILEKLITDLPVDINRIYVHGLSGGAVSTWDFAIAYKNLVAAAFPMSGSNDNAKTDGMLYMPLRQAQGEKDTNPAPGWTQTIVDWFNTNGGHLEYFFLPGVGHGTWETMYARSDFFSWFLSHKKNEIQVLYNRNLICPGAPVSVTMGFSPGFDAYEWMKDGVLISGATQYKVTVTEFGQYTGRIKNRGVWSEWAAPVTVGVKPTTYTPAIQVSPLYSKVLPAPDGRTTTSLEEPEGYQAYTWKNSSNQVVGSSRVFTEATVGTYTAVVQEQNGCSSVASPVFTVINANGTNKPDAISGFIGYALSQTSIALTWIDNPSPLHNESAFEIYRGASATGPFKLIAITASNVINYTDTGLIPNTKYYYLIRPVNETSAGPESEKFMVETKVDATVPTTPGNLVITAATNNSVSLKWDASTDNVGVYKYDIYKNGVKTLTVSGTSATVYNLTANELYTFYVRARDFTGNLSPESNQVSQVASLVGLNYKYYEGTWSVLPNFNNLTPIKTGSGPYIDLTQANRTERIAFYWEGYIYIPVAGNYTFETRSDDGSKLYIGGYGSTYQVVNNDGGHGMQYAAGTKNFAAPGSYPIVITYFNGTGSYGMEVYWKNTAHGISTRQKIPASYFKQVPAPPGSVPAPPTQLAATAISYNQINLTWTDNSNNETGFQVYRATSNTGPYGVIGTVGAGVTAFVDQAVQPATKYFYRVEAINQYGKSGLSNEKVRGVNYSYYEQTLTTLTTIDTYTPLTTGITPGFDISVRQRDAQIGFKWEGTIRIATAGNYTFYTTSDDGSRLYIDGVSVVNNDFDQGMTERSGTVNNLTAGVHNIKVLYRNGSGGFGMEVRYAGPGITKQLIPASVLADEEANATTLALPPVPTAPGSFTATALSPNTIQLSWTDLSTNEDNFMLYRSAVSSSNFVQYRTFPANTTAFTDTALFANLNYYYKLVAVNVGGNSTEVLANASTLNNNPVVENIDDVTVKYGTTINLSVMASDADNEPLTLSALNFPAFTSFVDQGDGSGTATFAPTDAGQVGIYDLSVVATDTHSGKDTAHFKLIITDTNPPAIVPVNNVSINEGQTTNVIVSASSDLGAANLTWEVVGLPSFGQFAASNGMGTITLTPDYIHSGVYTIQVKVTDPEGSVATRSFTVTVGDVDPNTTYYVNIVNSTSASTPWNNVTGLTTNNLKDDKGQTTPVGFVFNTTAWNTFNEGAVTGNNSGVYPDNVIRDYYYFGIFGAPNTISVDVTGLDPARQYTFSFLGSSKWTGVADNGSTSYTINSTTATLNVQNNSQNVATISDVTPNASGVITFTMSKAGSAPVGYLNALVIKDIYQNGTAPAAPRALTAATTTDAKVLLTWVDAPFNETGFDVYRATSESGPFTKVNASPVAANATQYLDSNNLQDNVTYYYKVNASNTSGTSAYSNVASVLVPNVAPVVTVTGNTTIVTSQQSVLAVSATDAPDNLLTIEVIGLPAFASYQSVNATSGNIEFNPGASDDGQYSFTIKATDAEGGITEKPVTVTVNSPILYKIMVNFSSGSNAPAPWNNTAKVPAANDVFSNLKNDSNVATTTSLTLQTGFGGVHNEGAVTGNDSGVVPDAVLREYYWFGVFNAPNSIAMKVAGLSKENRYNFKFVGSSNFTNNGAIADNGSTVFTIGTKISSVNVQGNTTNMAIIKDIVTNSAGEVYITVTKGPNAPAGYVNAMIIEAMPIDPALFVPTNLSAAGASASQIVLNWSDNSPSETGFEIYRATGASGTYSLLSTVGADVATYTDNSVSAGQMYYYKVRAVLAGGPTAYTNVASSGTIAFSVYVNLAGDATYDAPAPWNNVSRFGLAGDIFYGFKNSTGQNTGIQMRVQTALEGANNWGMNTGNNSGIFPDKVLQSFYFNDAYFPAGEFIIEGLDQGFNYNFGFLGSIDVTLTVMTDFTIGDKTVTNRNDKNTSTVSYIRDVVPDQNSEILFTVREASGSPWSIWNALVIQAYPTDRQIPNARTAKVTRKSTGMHEVRYGESRPILTLYPNPAVSYLNVKTDDASIGAVRYMIFDMMGKIIKEGLYQNDNVTMEMNLDLQESSMLSSVYFVKVFYPDGKVMMSKFIKK